MYVKITANKIPPGITIQKTCNQALQKYLRTPYKNVGEANIQQYSR